MICAKEDHGYPSEWSPTTVGKICEIVGGSTPSRKVPEYWGGPIPWATPSDITSLESIDISATSDSITESGLKSSAAKVLPAGSILMTSRATIGYCAINRVPMATNQGFANLICGPEVDSIFMLHWLTFMKPKIKRLASGSTFAELSKKSLRSLAIYLPPMTEQRRIAEILHSCDLATHITKKSIKATKKCKKGLMQRLLTRGIGHTRFKKTKLGEIPEAWELVILGDVASSERDSFVDGPFGSNLKVSDQTESGVRLIQLQNIGDGEFLNTHRRFTSEAKFVELKRHATYPGNVVIAKMANPVARACLVPPVEQKFLVVADCMRLRVNEKRFDPQFVVYAINSTATRAQAIRRSTGTTRLRISLTSLKGIVIPHPPKEEQALIVGMLLRIDELLQNECFQVDQLEILKKGLMQALLSGKVRVKV